MVTKVIVLVQFLLIAAVAVTGEPPLRPAPLSVLLFGLLFGIWAVAAMRLDNLRILPEPREGIRFVTRGPYRFLRHPMYTSVLASTISFTFGADGPLPFLLWAALFLVLLWKMRIEERLLRERLSGYAEYRERTWRLVPFIF